MAKKDKKIKTVGKESSSSEIARRFKANPGIFIGTVIVLVLIIVSFVLVPAIVPENRARGGDLTFGYYGKAPISWVPGNYFADYHERLMRYYRDSIDPNDFQVGITIWRQAFEAAAVHTAILQEMKASNYTIPVRTVDRQVAQMPQFQENGRFSSALYQQMSDTNRLVLWRQVNDELTKIQYYNDLFGLLTPSGEADFIGNMSSNTRNFDVVSFLVDDFPASEYLSFANENADLFSTIHLSRISVNSNEREARRILNSVKDGTSTFEDAARAQSQDSFADRGGDIGVRYVFELEQEISGSENREKIFSLAKGEFSDIIKLESDWVFFRVEEELKHANFEDDTVMERVRSYMKNFARGRMEDWAIAQAKDFIVDAELSGFDNAVRWRNKEKHSFGPLSINYGNVDLFASLSSFSVPDLSSQELNNLSQNENFWKVAFSTKLNTLSEPLVQGGKVLVFLPTEQIDVDETAAEEIASMYSSYWLGSTTEQSLQSYFMGSEKMDNRFWDTYYRLFMSGN